MRNRVYYILGVVFGIILLSMVIVMLSGGEAVLYCSPNSPRISGVADWEATISPVQEPVQLDEGFFDSFVISSNNDGWSVEYSYNNIAGNSFAYELSELTPGEPLNIGGGSLEFSAIGTAYLGANQELEDDAKYRYYNSRLQSISDEEVSELENDNIIEKGMNFRYNFFPSVQFGIKSQDIEDLMFHGIQIFDASTHAKLAGGLGRSEYKRHCWYNTHIPLWHRAAVDVVIDVSYGPTKTFEFAPQAGEGFEYDIFKCRLIHVFEGVDTSHHSSSSNEKVITQQLFKAAPDEASLCFFFACQLQANQIPVTFKFLDADGNILKGLSQRSSSNNSLKIYLHQPLDRVALIRARTRTRRQRIVIRLPYIPGLPEENDAIDDLFDVYIPYVRLRDPGRVGRFLTQTLQLRHSRSTGRIPQDSFDNSLFPLDFYDVTLREIAERYGQGGSLKVDLENEKLSREYPVSLLERLEQYLEKLFR